MDCSSASDCFHASVSTWVEWKIVIKESVGWRSDSLHVILGVLIQIGVGLLVRKSLSSVVPWALLFIVVGGNEAIDTWATGKVDYAESAKDIGLTMIVPTILLITTRLFPRLYRRAP